MTTRSAAWAALLLTSCVGPTIEVGEHVSEVGDAGRVVDASDARVRDANFGDRDFHLDERWPCRSDEDCEHFQYRRECSPFHFWCVECTDDNQCSSRQCVEPEGYCRDDDPVRPHDPQAPSQP